MYGIRAMNEVQLLNALAKATGMGSDHTAQAIKRELDRRAGKRSRVA